MMCSSLPESSSAECEMAVVFAARNTPILSPQTLSFLDLAPEVRNRIYEYSIIPSYDEEIDLTVATRFRDAASWLGDQPALTRTCRQVRSETLSMFYGEHTFTAYIRGLDFRDMIDWIRNLEYTVDLHIRLLDRERCIYDFVWLIKLWQEDPRLSYINDLQVSAVPEASKEGYLWHADEARAQMTAESVVGAIEWAEELDPEDSFYPETYFERVCGEWFDCKVEGDDFRCRDHGQCWVVETPPEALWD